MNPPLDLVIFDCDGVLVDSEVIMNRVFRTMLGELGLDLTLEEMFETFVGKSMPQCVVIITEMLGEAPPENFLDELAERAGERLRAEVEAVEGVESVIDSLTVPFCVASSGAHEKIRLTLGTTGLLPRFDGRIFSVTDPEVEHAKPEPDIFLHAARTLGTRPEACVVVEDTPTGVRAGVAAGMQVIGFSARTPEQRLREAGAHHVFSTMAEVGAQLRAYQDEGR